MSTGSRRYQVPHFILPHITRCPALLSRIFFPAFTRCHSRIPHFRFLPTAETSRGRTDETKGETSINRSYTVKSTRKNGMIISQTKPGNRKKSFFVSSIPLIITKKITQRIIIVVAFREWLRKRTRAR